MNLRTFIFLAVGAVLSPIQAGAQMVPLCVRNEIAARTVEGEVFSFAPSEAQALIDEVSEAIGLLSGSIVVISCSHVDNAGVWVPRAEEAGVPIRRYLVYNEDWLRLAVGTNRWQAIAIFGHELGHFVDGHFAGNSNLSSVEREARADRFAGCAVARMGGMWSDIENILSRVRRDQDQVYPNRLASLEAARLGFEGCGGHLGQTGEGENTASYEPYTRSMQIILSQSRCYEGPTDGIFGRRTERAFVRFSSYFLRVCGTLQPLEDIISDQPIDDSWLSRVRSNLDAIQQCPASQEIQCVIPRNAFGYTTSQCASTGTCTRSEASMENFCNEYNSLSWEDWEHFFFSSQREGTHHVIVATYPGLSREAAERELAIMRDAHQNVNFELMRTPSLSGGNDTYAAIISQGQDSIALTSELLLYATTCAHSDGRPPIAVDAFAYRHLQGRFTPSPEVLDRYR